MKRSIEDNAVKIKPYIPKRLRTNAIEKPTPPVLNAPTEVKNDITIRPKRPYIKHNIIQYQLDEQKKHNNVVNSICWNPFKTSLFATASLDHSVVVWDTSNRKLNVLKRFQEHSEGVKDIKWNHDGSKLLTASFDKTSKLFNIETGVNIQTFGHDDLVTSVVFHPTDSHIFLTGTFKSGVFAWDVRLQKSFRSYVSFFGQVQDMLFLPDCKTFLTSAEVIKKNSMDKAIMAWDFDTSAVLSNQIYQEPYICSCLKLHPNETTFLAQSAAGYIVIFDVKSPFKMNKYKRYEGHQSSGYRIGFDITFDGNMIYCGDNDGRLFAYNSFTSKLIRQFQVFTSPCLNVACNPSSKSMLACCSWDGTVALWE